MWMEIYVEHQKFNKAMITTYIGYSTNQDIRNKSTSGGIGSSIIKYLFEKNIIQSSISFKFDKKTLQYQPHIIYNYSEYNICGSIYHEINLIQFIKENIHLIKGTFLYFAIPCQIRPINQILKNANIESISIGLVCSSQQTIGATKYLLKRLNIEEKDVKHIQYRGNGWPSGIQIKLEDGKEIHLPNNKSLWSDIFHSKLFIKKKCFLCNNTFNKHSDIALADPWLKEYISSEKIGKTLIICNSTLGDNLIKDLYNNNIIKLEHINKEQVLKSQIETIKLKQKYRSNKKLSKYIILLYCSTLYRKISTGSCLIFKIHCKLKNIIEYKIFK